MNNNPFEQQASNSNLGQTGGSIPPAPSTPPQSATPSVNPNPFAAPSNPTPPPANVAQPTPAVPASEQQSVPIVTKPATPPNPNTPPPSGMYQPVKNEASGGKGLLILIVVFIIIVILGGLFFASWEGWINLGGIEKYWKKTSVINSNTPTNTNTSTVNANDQQRKTDLGNIKTALTAYYQANQAYPVAATEQKTADPKCVLNTLVPTYLATLPVDPMSPAKYYGYQSDGKSYTLTTVLEDVTDPLGIQVGSVYIYKVTDSSVETPQANSSNTNSNANTNSVSVEE